jgi:hypothetical protein
MKSNKIGISEYFRKVIDDSGSPIAFAEKYNLSTEAIQDYYDGKRKPNDATLKDIAIKIELWKILID